MDQGCAFKLLLSCPSGLLRSEAKKKRSSFVMYFCLLLCVKSLIKSYIFCVSLSISSCGFQSAVRQIPHPDPNLEQSINKIWNERIQENSSLYSGQKFRYAGHSLHQVDDSEQDSSICLHLGLTDYRTFVGTNLNPLWEKFLVSSEDDSVRCQHTSSPLGNGTIVETIDNKILVLQRSNNVGEFPGYFVFPGGHSEPREIGISSHLIGSNSTEAAPLNQKVPREMFEGIIREVVEENGAPAESLCDPLFIGISRRDLNVRPAAFYYIKCNLAAKEIYHPYSRAQDGYESTHLYTVSKDELDKMALKMPGCHRGGYALYVLMIELRSNKTRFHMMILVIIYLMIFLMAVSKCLIDAAILLNKCPLSSSWP